MSWAEVKKINGNMAKSLDELITEKTNVKIQTVTVYVPSESGAKHDTATSTGTTTIETIDASKSLIVPISPVISDAGNIPRITGVTYNLTNTSVSVSATYYTAGSYGGNSFTVAVITFGGNVS